MLGQKIIRCKRWVYAPRHNQPSTNHRELDNEWWSSHLIFQQKNVGTYMNLKEVVMWINFQRNRFLKMKFDNRKSIINTAGVKWTSKGLRSRHQFFLLELIPQLSVQQPSTATIFNRKSACKWFFLVFSSFNMLPQENNITTYNKFNSFLMGLRNIWAKSIEEELQGCYRIEERMYILY